MPEKDKKTQEFSYICIIRHQAPHACFRGISKGSRRKETELKSVITKTRAMKEIQIPVCIRSFSFEELSPEDCQLIEEAKKATSRSYSPYSHFAVGAAIRLKNGMILTGSNQENAAYPSGLCAERTVLFYASAQYPDQPVQVLAIAARNENGFLQTPIPPCGACRQVMLETEQRHHTALRILLYGEKYIYEIEGTKTLMPLSFGEEFLSSEP